MTISTGTKLVLFGFVIGVFVGVALEMILEAAGWRKEGQHDNSEGGQDE